MAFNQITYEDVDIKARAYSRMFLQFRNSVILIDVLMAFIEEIQTLQDAIKGVIEGRGPYEAIGEQLNAIGRIVGQAREVFNYTIIAWFSPDTVGAGADQGPSWVENAPLLESLEADDAVYRQLIEAKVFRNFSKYASVTEIQEMIRLAFGQEVSFARSLPANKMEVDIIVNISMPLYVLNFLMLFKSSAGVEDISLPPYLETLNVRGIYFIPTVFFQPDVGSGADVGGVAIFSEMTF